MPLLLLKPMGQSRRGVIRALEVQVRPMVVVISRFIQLLVPLPPLKPNSVIRITATPRRD
jgi:hypothetical protein